MREKFTIIHTRCFLLNYLEDCGHVKNHRSLFAKNCDQDVGKLFENSHFALLPEPRNSFKD